MIICYNDTALMGNAHTIIPINEDPQRKYKLNRLNAGQGQNNIGGAHLHHVDCAMHA